MKELVCTLSTAFLVLLAGGNVLGCATNSKSQTVANKNVKVSYEVATLLVSERQYRATLDTMVKGISNLMNTMLKEKFRHVPDHDQRMIKMIEEAFPREELLEFTAQTYESTFTQSELEQIRDFYTSNAGSKLIEKSPELVAATLKYCEKLIPERFPKLFGKYFKELSE